MKNGLIINKYGPAVEYTDGSKDWFIKGKFYREDSPAVELPLMAQRLSGLTERNFGIIKAKE